MRALIVAGLVATGAHPLLVLVIATFLFSPILFLLGAGLWAFWSWWMRRKEAPGAEDEATYLEGVAGELRAGASLRSALVAAAARVPRLDLSEVVRLAAAGGPLDEPASVLRRSLPVNGTLTEAAVQLAGTTGASSAALFHRLSVAAAEAAELRRARRSLTTQARLSAAVVGGAGLVATLAALGTGSSLFAAGGGFRILGLVGVGLELSGFAVVWFMVRRAET